VARDTAESALLPGLALSAAGLPEIGSEEGGKKKRREGGRVSLR